MPDWAYCQYWLPCVCMRYIEEKVCSRFTLLCLIIANMVRSKDKHAVGHLVCAARCLSDQWGTYASLCCLQVSCCRPLGALLQLCIFGRW